MVRKKFIQPREHPSRSSRLSGSTSSGTKWIFPDNIHQSTIGPSLDDLSSEERVVVSILIKLWEVEPLDPKNLFSNEEAARKFIDELARIQKMLLRSVDLSYDVGREIPKFRSTIAAKDKVVHESAVKIKNLNATLATLQEENEKLKLDVKLASEKREAAEKQVSESQGKLKESEEQRLSLAMSVADAKKAAVDGVPQTEKNIKDQCALIAPDIDFSGVSAYKKVVNDEVIEF
ncbi:hypothetical protein PIB30_064686 [Stylosanthes scabra]|uniref:Uncharacterized protein n=1 Tax=Stylosanthes scabra TaxID=79078 RepID=A0ABU6VMS1_9FABA|nr:hypothetical protein [Stylosanthes scabra]